VQIIGGAFWATGSLLAVGSLETDSEYAAYGCLGGVALLAAGFGVILGPPIVHALRTWRGQHSK
jgi:hypothetical protein